ncbi:MAG: Gfo/Idh/MocA family oxidoreductase [Candidatus Omnitrophica bacterium]|nr:Gfo/Idh/MocA family oxidoreductase [Candidatus Omnitrophota bacterium]
MPANPFNRRSFLKKARQSGVALAAAALTQPRRILAANEKIRIGLIGCGGRGCHLMALTQNIEPNAEFAAVCDAYEPKRNRGKQIAGENAQVFVDHRRLLEMKDLDAVIIATPEHLHGTQLIDAVAAGKDVYVEKPMTYSIEEGVRIIQAVRQSDRIVQVGMQRRSAPMCIEAKQLIDQGVLGDVTLVRAQWYWNVAPLNPNVTIQGELDWDLFLGPAPKRPFDPRRAIQWNWYWDYSGGMVTGQGVHLLDLLQWFMGKGTPLSAVMQGGSYKLGGECPDVFSASYEYDGYTASWILSYNNCFDNGWKVTFHGTEGTLVIGEPIFAEGETGYRIYKEPWRDMENRKPIYKSEEGLPTEPHIVNWLECMRSRKEPNAPVEVGHTAAAPCHLAIQAYRNKTIARLDKKCTKLTLG